MAKKYICKVCGYVHTGDKAPEICPQCQQKDCFEPEKKGLDTNSNIYTFVYMTAVVIVVAVLLAVVSQALAPKQQANILLDKQKQILGALKVDFSQADPAEVYYTLVQDTLNYGEQEVYVANLNGATKYILPLSGKGLWGGIGGYLALDEDKNTIYGVNFNHESETPGLGAKIVEPEFRSQFEGKHIRNAEGAVVSVAVLKAGKHAEGQEQVDAISGATITSSGVSTMLEVNLTEYAAFLNEGNGDASLNGENDENVEPVKEED